ncbi:PepSY-associated TM helix domain-containing protein [Phenylobacterium sp.]|uniref:PepSY-associated TM helix domain-containing protein n=1 Tax=Phenylobacterium sp. TaxID=1871053 RepID=UPI0025D02C07|nr:PepSY-associated TM helix domain-containing protein [Phenylobacterium sp.]MBX3483656.1 PepSY-associated TM helix domain-containing protein [Phenylobacterium sp.]
MKADAKPKAARKTAKGGSWKGELYRQSRAWHGYLSAFAFLALIFFSVTGLLLNHPEWTADLKDQPEHEARLQFTPAEIAAVNAAKEPPRALAAAVAKKTPVLGEFQSGEIIDGEAQLRLEGVKGATDILGDLTSGEVEVTTKASNLLTTLNDLHRGKNAGAAWKAVIDISAIVVIALSVIGYVLFFSLRFRLRTSLILTAVSLAGLVAVVVLFTP